MNDRYDDYFLGALTSLVLVNLYHSIRVSATAYNRLLQVFLIFFTTHAFNGWAISIGFQGPLIHWYKIPYVANAVLVVATFLYLRKLMANETGWHKKDLIFAIPPLVVIGAMFPFYLSTAETKREIWIGLGNHGLFARNEAIAATVLVATILVFQFRQIRDYLRFRNGTYWSSNAAQSEEILHWIRFVNYIVGILALLSLGYIALRGLGLVGAINGLFRLVFYATDLVLLFYIAVHPKVFRGLPAEHISKPKASNAPSIHVTERMQESALFLDPELTLYRAALEWGIAPPTLSQLIKDQTQQNFSQFVNAHRISHCKHLMLTEGLATQTIEALGLRAGFASRASFYRAFQQFEQCTPSEWLARQGTKK
jgi:AraC-like DNA-binding protein